MSLRQIHPDSEKVYLSQDRKDPRPVYLIQEGIPVEMRFINNTLGIQGPETLIAYKSNAGTNRLMKSQLLLGELDVKCLPSQHALLEKMREQGERYWDIYPRYTSQGKNMTNRCIIENNQCIYLLNS